MFSSLRVAGAAFAAAGLCGCASQLAHYVRTDGAPVNEAQERATLAQCKGEASTTITYDFGGSQSHRSLHGS
jgi:hypothetical protein